jgi:hypothetical protein
MSPKDDLLSRAEQEYQSFRTALQGLSEARLNEVWYGSWSIKDIVAHLTGWHRELLPALERIARGERPVPAGTSYDNFDEWNEKFASALRSKPVAELLTELDQTHTSFLRAAALIPEARFEPARTAYKLVDLNTAHHYREHGDEIRAWRASRGL